MKTLYRATVPALSLILASATPAFTQVPDPSSLSETYGNWTVHCRTPDVAEGQENAPARRVCQMSQEIRQNGTNQRVLMSTLRVSADDTSKMETSIILPFGLDLGKGITVLLGNETAIEAPFKTCLPVGCVVTIMADQTLLDPLRASEKLTVSAQADGTGQEIKIDAPLKGFPEAMDRLIELSSSGK